MTHVIQTLCNKGVVVTFAWLFYSSSLCLLGMGTSAHTAMWSLLRHYLQAETKFHDVWHIAPTTLAELHVHRVARKRKIAETISASPKLLVHEPWHRSLLRQRLPYLAYSWFLIPPATGKMSIGCCLPRTTRKTRFEFHITTTSSTILLCHVSRLLLWRQRKSNLLVFAPVYTSQRSLPGAKKIAELF